MKTTPNPSIERTHIGAPPPARAMPFRKIKGHELASCFSWRGLAACSRVAASPQRSHKAMTLQHSGDYRVNSAMEAK